MSARSRYPENIRRISVHSAQRKFGDQGHFESLLSGATNDVGHSESLDANNRGQEDGYVRVAVRCRPMSEKEVAAGYESIVDLESEQRLVVHEVGETPSEHLGTKSSERRNVSHVYDFDQVLDWHSSQAQVYESVCRPIVQSALEGYNGTIFVYGQTGTGKTYTMEGLASRHRAAPAADDTGPKSDSRRASSAKDTQTVAGDAGPTQASSAELRNEHAGIIPRAFEQIFEHVARHPEAQFLIRASYLEIYQEEIRDLLKKRAKSGRLELHERADVGVYVKDLTSFVCKSIGEIERVMRVGNQNRIVGATDMNERSSRSHAIFMITIEQQQQQQQQQHQQQQQQPQVETKLRNSSGGADNKSPTTWGGGGGADKSASIRVGKLNLVDLAGSERQRKTNTFGERQKESIKINLSLSALGNVINSLMKLQQQHQQQQQQQLKEDINNNNSNNDNDNNSHTVPPVIHTPYRDSKLTRLLQDSLGGNAKTLMIANIGPASYNYDETINTLNYASRARCIRNRPRVNEDPKDALLRQLQLEIESVRAKLAANLRQQQQQQLEAKRPLDGSQESSGVSSANSLARADQRGGGGGGGGAVSTTTTPATTITSAQKQATGATASVERQLLELRQKLASLESKLLNGVHSATLGHQQQLKAQQQQQQQQQQHKSAAEPLGRLDGERLKGFTRDQELELERRQHELAHQVGRERAIRDELERREEAELVAKRSFSSVRQEVEAKRRLIRQLLLRVKSMRDEIYSSQRAYRLELDELEQLQAVLQRELKLKCLIMDNFVANGHVDQLLERVLFDERRNLCYIEPLELPDRGACNLGPSRRTPPDAGGQARADGRAHSPDSFHAFWRPTYASIRPMSEFERISEAIYPNNIRYKYELLIEPSLGEQRPCSEPQGRSKLSDKLRPETTTTSGSSSIGSTGTAPAPQTSRVPELQALIDQALAEREPDIVI